MEEKHTLYCYIRVSLEEQKLKDYSPALQKSLGIKKATELKYDYEILEEGAASASKMDFENRPVFAKLLQLVKDGIAKHIFVFDQSRLSRNNITKAIIVTNFSKQGVQLYTHSKAFDFNKAEDEMVFTILQAIEAYETFMRVARFQIGYISANRVGRFLKLIPPFGFVKDNKGFLVVEPEEKKIYLKIVEFYLEKGWGTNQIANWLNNNNIPTKTSKILKNGYKLSAGVHNRKKDKLVKSNLWNPGTVNSILKNELYTGKRKFKTGDETYEYVDIEPFITEEIFLKMKYKRAENLITKKKADKYFYLLKGLLECKNCGNAMHGRIKPNRGEKTYRCNSKRISNESCNSLGVNIDKIESVVLAAFKDSISFQQEVINMIEKEKDSPEEIKAQIVNILKNIKSLKVNKTKVEQRITDVLTSFESKVTLKSLEKIINTLNNDLKTIISEINIEENRIKYLNASLSKTKNNDVDLFYNSLKSLIEIIDKPDKNINEMIALRTRIGEAIKTIIVEWNQNKKSHNIEICYRSPDPSNPHYTLHSIPRTGFVSPISLANDIIGK